MRAATSPHFLAMVPEIPTHEMGHMVDGANGDMACVIGEFLSEDSSSEVSR